MVEVETEVKKYKIRGRVADSLVETEHHGWRRILGSNGKRRSVVNENLRLRLQLALVGNL
jgi:hypothetical protein